MNTLVCQLFTRLLSLSLLLSASASAQERTVDPTWLHRFLPGTAEAKGDPSAPTCHNRVIFGQGNGDAQILRSVSHFSEVTIDPHGSCASAFYDREEEIYFVTQGTGLLQFAEETHPLRTSDFVYFAPGVKHGISNNSTQPLRVLVMAFKVPARVALSSPPPRPRVINLDDVKEELVQGHPTSVLYKLMVGPRKATRDAIDDAYVVTSLFWMDFAPGGTNFPHHHETAEEIYLVMDGEGQMVAGSGMDGIEARFPAKAGDAYYFRPNCTVGFYNRETPGAKAHILAVRSKISLSSEDD